MDVRWWRAPLDSVPMSSPTPPSPKRMSRPILALICMTQKKNSMVGIKDIVDANGRQKDPPFSGGREK